MKFNREFDIVVNTFCDIKFKEARKLLEEYACGTRKYPLFYLYPYLI